MKRFGVRRSAWYGGALAIVTFVALTLFVVLPALASNPGDKIPPASGPQQNFITPTDVNIGGNAVCSNLFPSFSGVKEYDNPSPKTQANLPSGNNDGVTFSLQMSGGINSQRLAVTSSGAAILGMGVKGGNDNAVYDYTGTDYGPGAPAGWVSGDSNLHAPASKFTGVDATGTETGVTQWYTVSHLVVCYRTPLATISGRAYKVDTGNPGISGLKVTLVDTSVPGGNTQTVPATPASGNYSFSAVAGDNYTVCISAPAFANVQTVPATDTGSCSGPKGYSITGLTSSNGSGKDFGFQPLGSVSGTVYQDINGPPNVNSGPDGHYQSGIDSPLNNWTVTLYGGASPVATQTQTDGSYSFSQAFSPGTQYTLCVTPNTGSWAQSEPLPSAPDNCVAPNLPKGQQFTPNSASGSFTNVNFGNSPSTACQLSPPFGLADGSYLIKLAQCKDGVDYAFNQGSYNGKPWVSVWPSDQKSPRQLEPMVEKITFPYDSALQNAFGISYTDIFPFNIANAHPMRRCQIDPRDPTAADDQTLLPAYTDPSTANQILQPADPSDPENTSCIITYQVNSPAPDTTPDGTVTYWVYSEIDGLRNQT